MYEPQPPRISEDELSNLSYSASQLFNIESCRSGFG